MTGNGSFSYHGGPLVRRPLSFDEPQRRAAVWAKKDFLRLEIRGPFRLKWLQDGSKSGSSCQNILEALERFPV